MQDPAVWAWSALCLIRKLFMIPHGPVINDQRELFGPRFGHFQTVKLVAVRLLLGQYAQTVTLEVRQVSKAQRTFTTDRLDRRYFDCAIGNSQSKAELELRTGSYKTLICDMSFVFRGRLFRRIFVRQPCRIHGFTND